MSQHHLFLGAVLVLLVQVFVMSDSTSSRSNDDGWTPTMRPTRMPIFREASAESVEQTSEPATSQSQDGNTKAAVPYGSAPASERLMKELKNIRKSDSHKSGFFKVELFDDNLYEWNVKLFLTGSDSPLEKDLQRLKEEGKGEDHLLLRVSFKDDFPRSPPFVRIVYPLLGQRGRTLVHKGGVLCLEMLSGQGWQSDYTIEGVILVVADIFIMRDRVAEYNHTTLDDFYTEERARATYERIENIHKEQGWNREI